MEPLRIGILGAARIAGKAIVEPARLTGARLVAVAARDAERAQAFAAEHGVERVHAGYDDVINDPDVEVIYNPLANGLHGPWNLKAIAAGKHVLTEKPSASNAAEAAQVRDAAREQGVVLMEGFHYVFHPVTRRLHELLSKGELGELQHVETTMVMPPCGRRRPALVAVARRWRGDGRRLLCPARAADAGSLGWRTADRGDRPGR